MSDVAQAGHGIRCACVPAASRNASARPTMPATFSVPERRPRSWPPPCSTGSSGIAPRTASTPIPFGAPSLWPVTLSASTPSWARPTSSQPADWTASVWNGTPAARAIAASSAIGWTVPSSLLACAIVTRVVSGRSAAAKRRGVDETVGVHRQLGHLEVVVAPQVVRALEHRLVLGRAS